eukprot:CAMPEP_0170466004 /NCGR_PEP_ID=MMETSP0123-20130129/10140_1 /TAXON_ID=182087 /ORGANISM="Favella ehrenbergii, Strain Fehren 1" /LENGTH=80 /DNA_ID=CAMNT_0010732051 /DNA_START=420 /DNA_END=662 /DNA_ORIENTATION=+
MAIAVDNFKIGKVALDGVSFAQPDEVLLEFLRSCFLDLALELLVDFQGEVWRGDCAAERTLDLGLEEGSDANYAESMLAG